MVRSRALVSVKMIRVEGKSKSASSVEEEVVSSEGGGGGCIRARDRWEIFLSRAE